MTEKIHRVAGFINKFARYCGGSVVMVWLIIINLLVFVAAWGVILIGHACGLEGNFTMSWLCVPSLPAMVPSRCWTLLTYMVTQYDVIHLLFNLLWLFWFGNILPEWVTERRRLIFYVGGGLAGAVTYVICNLLFPALTAPGSALCGASAAVLSMMAAAGILGGDRKVYLILVGPVAAKWVCLGCIILAFFGFGGGSAAAQSAHIGGVLFGLVYSLILKSAPRRQESWSNTQTYNRQESWNNAPTYPRQESWRHPQTYPGREHQPKRKIRVNVRRDGKAVADTMAGRLSDTERLDQLLDKIRLSGYASLTLGERNELNAISRRLGK